MTRPSGECYDCGRRYGGLGWIDCIVPDEVWRVISPVPEIEGAGLLCICCIAKRCAALGLHDVDVSFTSGPLTLTRRNS
jgi:hypothetical protein